MKSSTPEQLATMTSKLFFNICNEWQFTDNDIAKMLNASVLKIKSLRRMSAYFNEQQMLIAVAFLSIYNDLALVLEEKVTEKGKRSKEWINTPCEAFDDCTPKRTICDDRDGIDAVRNYLSSLKKVL